uniref:alpha-1,6-mannosyl-glycoprotein 6-beta-N-acetylglucosaminyltransferase n=1 Tax=Salarias fasciatus TaxID=181472 RepID=A0A672FEQ5_SALFA
MATPFLWKLSSQKLGFFLVSFGFIWGMMLLHFTIQQAGRPTRAAPCCASRSWTSASATSRRWPRRTRASWTAVRGTMTAYDLKKTLAVLLDNIMLRLGKLESKVENIYNGTGANLTSGGGGGGGGTAAPSAANAEKVNVADLLNGAQEKCELPPLDGFPHCEGKLKWMKEMWRSDSCYSSYGVENWCPRLPWRTKILNEEIDRRGQVGASIRTSFEELYRSMSQREEFRWMMLRIKRMAEPWVSAIRSLAAKQNLARRRRKKILVHLGLLTKESGFKIAENAFSGGPLGELVQWSDLITTLYLLGHDVRISAFWIMRKVMGNKSSCPTQGDKVVELIYIDIVGLTQFKKTLGPSWVHYHACSAVLDSFGTEPEFNHAHYAQSKGHKTPWGKWNLTPHTPDNSFLGFVVEQHLNASDIRHIDDVKRQNQSLVYGKVDNFWKKYLDIIHSYMEVHGTNHGILSGRDLQFLLRETKLFVGLSFPYEGPAPLEAIANGCAFLNPKFTPRRLTSQHPYAEVYIGEPHVWTVDIEDPAEVERAIRSILSQKIEPYLPYEFTCEGMLQRVNAFIENQDFCHGQVMWPPLGALQVKMADPGRSCKQVCQEEQLICEPSFFQHLNKDKDLARFGVDCQTVESSADTLVPAYSEARRHCVFQADLLLFSCAGAHPALRRVCPCRDYMKGQVALCKDCL